MEPCVMAIFAHPDDELAVAGTLAACTAGGAQVALVCATSGDLGSISDPSLATPETLGEVRREELRCSCRRLGIQHLEILPYLDSGWRQDHGEPPPGSLGKAPAAEVIARLVRLIRRYRPHAVITFGPDGLYGHCDHITIGAYAAAAFGMAGDEGWTPGENGLKPWRPARLFYVALPEVQRQMILAHTGAVAVGQVTHNLSVEPYLAAKVGAARCHETQQEMWQQMEAFLGTPEGRQMAGAECLMLALARPLPAELELPVEGILQQLLA